MWKSWVWPGSSRISQTRPNSFSNRIFCPTSPSEMPRSAAACNPNLSLTAGVLFCGNDGDGADLDQIIGRRHLGDFNHGRGRQRRLEILCAHFVDGLELLHVADIDIDTADIVERAAGGFHGGFHVLADLA